MAIDGAECEKTELDPSRGRRDPVEAPDDIDGDFNVQPDLFLLPNPDDNDHNNNNLQALPVFLDYFEDQETDAEEEEEEEEELDSSCEVDYIVFDDDEVEYREEEVVDQDQEGEAQEGAEDLQEQQHRVQEEEEGHEAAALDLDSSCEVDHIFFDTDNEEIAAERRRRGTTSEAGSQRWRERREEASDSDSEGSTVYPRSEVSDRLSSDEESQEEGSEPAQEEGSMARSNVYVLVLEEEEDDEREVWERVILPSVDQSSSSSSSSRFRRFMPENFGESLRLREPPAPGQEPDPRLPPNCFSRGMRFAHSQHHHQHRRPQQLGSAPGTRFPGFRALSPQYPPTPQLSPDMLLFEFRAQGVDVPYDPEREREAQELALRRAIPDWPPPSRSQPQEQPMTPQPQEETISSQLQAMAITPPSVQFRPQEAMAPEPQTVPQGEAIATSSHAIATPSQAVALLPQAIALLTQAMSPRAMALPPPTQPWPTLPPLPSSPMPSRSRPLLSWPSPPPMPPLSMLRSMAPRMSPHQPANSQPLLPLPLPQSAGQPMSSVHALRSSQRHRGRRPRCNFCQQTGEEDIWHAMKDEAGLVVCPILSQYVCKLCGATGSIAHTLKYCPRNKLTQGDPVAAGMPPGLMPYPVTLEDVRGQVDEYTL